MSGLPDGGWLVAWEGKNGTADNEIIYQRYNANGSTNGGNVAFEAVDNKDDRLPNALALSDGGWLLSWYTEDNLGDGEDAEIVSQRFDSAGVTQSFAKVDAPDVHDDYNPVCALLNDGGWVVAWHGRPGACGLWREPPRGRRRPWRFRERSPCV